MSYVVHKIDCPVEDCELPNPYYIGQIKISISRRITKHIQNGVAKDHIRNIHRNILTRSEIVKNVTCIKKFYNVKKQYI